MCPLRLLLIVLTIVIMTVLGFRNWRKSDDQNCDSNDANAPFKMKIGAMTQVNLVCQGALPICPIGCNFLSTDLCFIYQNAMDVVTLRVLYKYWQSYRQTKEIKKQLMLNSDTKASFGNSTANTTA